jgi:hypothetical protein
MTPSGFYQVVHDRARAAGLPAMHPYQLRHAFATSWLAEGRYAFSLKPRTTVAGASRHPLSEPELSLPSCHCAIGDQAPDHNSQE